MLGARQIVRVRRGLGLLAALVCALALCGPTVAPARAGEFHNPIIPTNLPDPSVVAADGAYWLSGTSGRFAPTFPIYRSTDLIHWSEVAAIFPVPPTWTHGNYWAPTLADTPQGWRAYYSASQVGGGPMCVGVAVADSPRGPWSDGGIVACPPTGAIDPDYVTDANGQAYLLWKAKGVHGGLWGAPLSPDGRTLAGDPVNLLNPGSRWERATTEGPDVVQHGGEYFLLYSGGGCCRPPCHYAVGVARAPSILGPYVKDPANPILRGGNGWKCPGHGSALVTPDGRDAFIHHAYLKSDKLDVFREVLLEPILWGADGWPSIGDRGRPVSPWPGPQEYSYADTFRGRSLLPGWEWWFDAPPTVTVGRGRVTVKVGQVSREWAPRDYVVESNVKGPSTLAVQTNTGQQIGVRSVLSPPPKPPKNKKARRHWHPRPRRVIGAQLFTSDDGTIARMRLARIFRLRLDVRGGQTVGAWVLAHRAGGWRHVGQPVQAPKHRTIARFGLGPGTFQNVIVRPLGASTAQARKAAASRARGSRRRARTAKRKR